MHLPGATWLERGGAGICTWVAGSGDHREPGPRDDGPGKGWRRAAAEKAMETVRF